METQTVGESWFGHWGEKITNIRYADYTPDLWGIWLNFWLQNPEPWVFNSVHHKKNIDNIFRKQTYAHGICWCFNGNIKWPQQTQILGQNIGGWSPSSSWSWIRMSLSVLGGGGGTQVQFVWLNWVPCSIVFQNSSVNDALRLFFF